MRGRNFSNDSIIADKGVAAALEAKRIAEKYGKDYLDCDTLAVILNVGRNNVRDLMRSVDFPTVTIGNRKVVSVIGFAMWSLKKNDGE